MSNTTEANNVKSTMLFDYIDSVIRSGELYYALVLRFYKLSDNSLKLSTQQTISDIFTPLNAKVFYLSNHNAVIIFKEQIKDEILSCLVRLKFILQSDPLLKDLQDLQQIGIAQIYDIQSQSGELKVDLNNSSNNTLKQPLASNSSDTNVSKEYLNIISKHKSKKILTPDMLAKVQKVLSVADFSSFIRRQSVCAVIGKSTPQRVFDEVYVSIPDLRDMLLPDVDLMANSWLFAALSETLDRRVLQTISRHDDGSLLGNFSININVSTILSDDFMYFDDNINASMRSSIVLELQLMDIFSDIQSFQLAKTFVQARGYKVCIDGITVDKMQYINRVNLNCDLFKIIWHPSFGDIIGEDPHFMDYTNKSERAKIILCRIDDPKAIEVGNSLGINLYQGRYIQRLLAPNSFIKK